jgi:hypothetical protein
MTQTSTLTFSHIEQFVKNRPNSQGYKAFLVGATGATGKELLRELLSSELCIELVTLTRRRIETTDVPNSNKLRQVIVNESSQFFNHEYLESTLKTEIHSFDVFFSCFGTSKKKAGGAENWIKIDPDMNKFFGRLSFKLLNIPHFSIVSSIGADKDSSFLYVKGKGEIEFELENYMKEYKESSENENVHTSLSIFRPSLLLAERENRPIFALPAQYIAPVISSVLFGSLRKYRAIDVKDVAKAMRIEFETKFTSSIGGVSVIESDLIQQIANLEYSS